MFKEGDIINNGYRGQTYKVIKHSGKLYADNGSHMFPLDSENYNLKKFKKCNKG